jgi:hypothetical protein
MTPPSRLDKAGDPRRRAAQAGCPAPYPSATRASARARRWERALSVGHPLGSFTTGLTSTVRRCPKSL